MTQRKDWHWERIVLQGQVSSSTVLNTGIALLWRTVIQQ